MLHAGRLTNAVRTRSIIGRRGDDFGNRWLADLHQQGTTESGIASHYYHTNEQRRVASTGHDTGAKVSGL
jgi:hypothetical protein